MEIPEILLPCLWLLVTLSALTEAQTDAAPAGCGQELNSLYYNLCDLSAAWGIVVEAIACAGIVSTFILVIVLVASIPFVQDSRKKSLIGTQVFFLMATFGLFCLVFDFVVKKNFATCASRRFLFGVLFGICFSCLWAHTLSLNFLVRKNKGPRGWWIFAVALGLSLVEVVINTEWLIITIVRNGTSTQGDPCNIENMDFVMALIYVLCLILATFISVWPTQCGRYRQWKKHGIFIFLTICFSIAIWVVWIVIYVYGNQQMGTYPLWDDPTLAIALVSNAWTFIFLYIIPEISQLTKPGSDQSFEEDLYPTRGVGYETILKEQKSQSTFVENKAFSMDEPSSAKKPVSPYSGYNGQLRSSVYQPTEMAMMNKGPQSEMPYDVVIPRATANSHALNSTNSTLRAEDVFGAQNKHAAYQEATNTQAHSRW
ncbi:G-protein coupled receptor family C group 5 member C isoform X1 [Microcaecilia unicolor]|uniref:G-protein coupled receptor family C group 5 member C isoform X1 n=1 Tax=Microcaecilia unicolor TaxID=1415580 RepID=A0A6P7YHI9_9AMPH|nr:G-protein coupled receptor family C group 5 member C isoform X1 [Microcaecilia unicolor]XP_030064416.1 G-protein coupled receptor family C group 5 member C isoform X1 [Microcaecilia unicolor]XP_030064417.1 G-protein coupled receptor family C group 5 member C isoform X1 [Microcaecilia unicolor]